MTIVFTQCEDPSIDERSSGAYDSYGRINPIRTVCGPAPDECYDNQGDPCQFGCNGGECLPDPDDENPDVGVLFDLGVLIAGLNSLLDTPLDDDQIAWIFESDENYEFAEEALEALENGGEVDFEEKLIIDPTVSPCVKSIIYNLKNNPTNISLIPNLPVDVNLSSLILNIFDNSSNHNYKIKVGNLAASKNAQTVPTSLGNNTFLYTTTLNSTYVKNATDLAIARTIIHESLHAYFEHTYQDSPFSTLSQKLRHYLSLNGLNNNAAQHQYMVEFVEAIAYSLQKWDNNSLSGINYYKYLAWSGDMLSTSDFGLLSSQFQTNVVNANIAEGQAGGATNASTSNAMGINNCN